MKEEVFEKLGRVSMYMSMPPAAAAAALAAAVAALEAAASPALRPVPPRPARPSGAAPQRATGRAPASHLGRACTTGGLLGLELVLTVGLGWGRAATYSSSPTKAQGLAQGCAWRGGSWWSVE